MQRLEVWVDGIGLLGPGLDDWTGGRAVLAGLAPARDEKTRVPAPTTLPAAERRRAGTAVKAAIAVGLQALQASGTAPQGLATVFTSSGGDGVNCHEICAALASSDRLISPTRFHNSVHNAPSGYWSISTGAMATSSVLCAHDGSFGAGLLEAMAQCAVDRQPVLLVAYDTDYPQPLRGVRPIPDTLGVALLLSPQAGPHSLARLALQPASALTPQAAQRLADPVLEALRTAIPTARSLPLLQALAQAPVSAQAVVLDYLPGQQLALEAAPC
nr:beta-ketoacyl synthase chain length factor [Ramlibacter tataouinensis]